MNVRAYLMVSSVIFAFVAVAHLLRFAMGWSVQLGTWNVPLWASLLAVLVSASVAIWGIAVARRI
jgi:hypothetical protein